MPPAGIHKLLIYNVFLLNRKKYFYYLKKKQFTQTAKILIIAARSGKPQPATIGNMAIKPPKQDDKK